MIAYKKEKHHIWAYLMGLVCILTPIAAIVTANALGQLTDYLSTKGLGGGLSLILLTCLYFAIEAFLGYGFTYCSGKIKASYYSFLQSRIQEKMFRVHPHYIKANRKDLYNSLSNDVDEITKFMSESLPNVLLQTIHLIFLLAYILFVDWRIAIVYFSAVSASVIIQALIGRLMDRTNQNIKINESNLNAKLDDVLKNRSLIKNYELHEFANSRYNGEGVDLFRAKIQLSCIAMPLKIAGIICGMIPIISVCLAGMYLIPRNLIETGTFISLFYLCQKSVPKQLHYVDLIIEIAKGKPARERIKRLLSEEERAEAEVESFGEGDIEVESVWYKYPDTDIWAISDVSMRIEKGSKIAFVGESGSGKSTMLKLISGELEPTQGTITKSNAIFTHQFPHIFALSLHENVFLGNENGDKTELYDACNITEMINQAEQRDEMILQSDGSNLSGGQNQRIAVARALNFDADLYLFDESVSALDSHNCKFILENIFKLKKESTVIMVLHQREFDDYFDTVYEFKDGKVIQNR